MKGKLCTRDADFQRVIVFQRNVEVWIWGELAAIGKMECFTDQSVKIDGNYYLRDNCQFIMK